MRKGITIVTEELEAFRHDGQHLFVYPTRDIKAIKGSISNQDAFKGTALAFLDEFGPPPCLGYKYVCESGYLSPCIVRTVQN